MHVLGFCSGWLSFGGRRGSFVEKKKFCGDVGWGKLYGAGPLVLERLALFVESTAISVWLMALQSPSAARQMQRYIT